MKIILSLLLFFSFLHTNSAEIISNTEVTFDNPIGEHAVVLSDFGLRTHPILNKQRMHTGVDLKAFEGERVKASASGKVISASSDELLGNTLVIEHSDGYVTKYAHLDSFDENITVGKQIEKGQTIGFAGKSDFSKNSVLHFEILLNDEPQNPLSFLR